MSVCSHTQTHMHMHMHTYILNTHTRLKRVPLLYRTYVRIHTNGCKLYCSLKIITGRRVRWGSRVRDEGWGEGGGKGDVEVGYNPLARRYVPHESSNIWYTYPGVQALQYVCIIIAMGLCSNHLLALGGGRHQRPELRTITSTYM